MTTLSLHSFMRSSRAKWIIAAVSWLALRGRRPTSCNVSSTRQHESSRTRASSTGNSLISSEVATLAGCCRPGSVQSLRPGVQMSAQDGSWIPVYLLPTRLRHLWPLPPAIGRPWSSRLPTCETCFVRRTFICIRRPFELELTSCLP